MQHYDFIIVGAGSAGCVLANRLSADPNNRVLLLEAGGRDWNPLIRIPLMAGVLYTWRSINWGYDTVRQAHLDGRSIHWPRGRVLGGSSAINGMVYIRGHANDYDTWRQMGLEGWSYADVLPYFKRSEDHADRRDAYHGTGGPLRVSRGTMQHPLHDAFFAACRARGHAATPDFNGARQEGFSVHDFTIKHGRRQSTATAFLDPARARPNLAIATAAQALHLVFEGRRAVGVTYRRRGVTETAYAAREIVLAGGAVNSPQLLMLSGIGPGDALRRHGIAVVAERPGVGENLQDHLGIFVQYQCREPITLYGLFRPDRAAAALARAYIFGRGPAAAIPLEACAYIRTRPELAVPDIKCTLVPGLSLEATQAQQMQHGFQITVHQLRPESRGRITLASNDPLAKPLIDPNYLSRPHDVVTMRAAGRIIRDLIRENAFAPYRGEAITPGDDVDSDAAWDAWIRANARTVFHPVGTCKMGDDAMAVVDAQLRVHGVDGLRIADASVMPTITGGNTNAPTIMIAEKAAAMLLGEAPLPRAEVP
ncbi:MAG: choline dehydrogenase [Alphaproteobacteria bacterium]|nr:choline dehydrogenase [Alphaproteobacteria bacterium]